MPISFAEIPTGVSRILIYGVTGSGKSTAAERIGERTGLPVTLVDKLTWPLAGCQSMLDGNAS